MDYNQRDRDSLTSTALHRYIWPVGYIASRFFTDYQDPDTRVKYWCTIQDGGENPLVCVCMRGCVCGERCF